MFLPDSIDLAQSEKYSLSIRLTPNGFSFLIFSASDKVVHYYNEKAFSPTLSMSENIKRFFFESNIFTHPFSRINVSVVSGRYTLVPNEFFDKRGITDLFRFNIHGDSGKVLYNYVESDDLNIIFDMEDDTYSFLYRNVWNPTFSNFISHLLPFCHSYGEVEKKRCFVFFDDDMISVVCYNGQALLSANTYTSSNQSDLIYNVVNIWDKHGFDQNDDFLYIDGYAENNWESINTLRQLIKNVEMIALPRSYKGSGDARIPTDMLLQL